MRSRQTACLCALFEAHTEEWAWKIVGDRFQRPHNLRRVDHDSTIRNRKQRTDIGKYSFVKRTIQLLNKLPADAVQNLFCKESNFKKRVRKGINVKCTENKSTENQQKNAVK
jgi:hypothetical protein